MIDYNPKVELISLHIPKSGGTSFDGVLKKWFGLGFRRHYDDHKKNTLAKRSSLGMMAKGVIPLCIHGHFDNSVKEKSVFQYYPDAKQFISIYRNPLDLQLSYYFYTKKLFKEGYLSWEGKKVTNIDYLGKDIDEHLEKYSGNGWLPRSMPWQITLDNYKDVIEKNFIHIGVTEKLQHSVNILAEKLKRKPAEIGMENTAKRNETPSESSVKIFKEIYKTEFAFYDYICKLNEV